MNGSPHPQPLSRLRAGGAQRVADATSPVTDRVDGFLRRHLPPGARLSVGYSGGLDSTVLLHCLAALRERHPFGLSACHVHHGLSPHADAWAEHCLRTGQAWSVPVEVHRVCVQSTGEGIEAAARAARYRVYAGLAVDAVALAHHRDDQAETVLLQLLRGGDLRALAAMPAERPLAGKLLLRPLLDVARSEIEAYAHAHALDWIEDESNKHTLHTRNALRHEVLPAIARHYPHVVADLAQAASVFAETAQMLDVLATSDMAEAMDAEGLRVDRLAALPTARALNLLRLFIINAGGRVKRGALIEALRQLLAADAQSRVEIRFGTRILRRFRGHACLIQAASTPRIDLLWRGETRLELPGLGAMEIRPAVGEGVRLTPGDTRLGLRLGGERMQPAANRPSRALKDWLREARVPPWRRDRLPLLYVGGRLAWAAELGVDVSHAVRPGETGWLISWTWAQSAPH